MLHHLVGGLYGRFGVEIRKCMAFGVLHEMELSWRVGFRQDNPPGGNWL